MTLFKPRFDPRSHVTGGCRLPGRRPSGVFTAPVLQSVPLACLCMGAATRTEDQGSSPKCAAYSCSSMAENILWRKTGRIAEIDPDNLYRYAKTIDGDPRGDGTTLGAILEALLFRGIFDRDRCSVKTIASAFDVKAAVHRYGTCLLGLDISDEWYKGRADITSTTAKLVGGHAVQCVGYDEKGVWIQNSWGAGWGDGGFARIAWPAFNRQFMYGGLLTGVFSDMS